MYENIKLESGIFEKGKKQAGAELGQAQLSFSYVPTSKGLANYMGLRLRTILYCAYAVIQIFCSSHCLV